VKIGDRVKVTCNNDGLTGQITDEDDGYYWVEIDHENRGYWFAPDEIEAITT